MSEGAGIASHAAAAALAAQRVVGRLGLDCAGMDVLHSSNDTTIHFPACGLVAKVGTSSEAPETFAREIAVARYLGARGAEIACPASGVFAGPYQQEGLEITLWEFVPHEFDPELDDDVLADSLGRLHRHLASYPGELPDYRERVRQTGRLLEDEDAMSAVSPGGLDLLRRRYAAVAPKLLELAQPTAVLHGAPHLHNVLVAPLGVRWIDFETCCRGPVEADLAYLGQAGERRAGVGLELLGLAQKMVCVGVATTCWRDPDRHPRIREAAEYTSLRSPPNRRVRSGEVVAERAPRSRSQSSIVRESQGGASLSAIADALTNEGVPTAHGGARWWAATIRKVLAGQQASAVRPR